MSDLVQNDWEIVEEALVPHGTLDGPHDPAHVGLEALHRLRESNRSMIAGLIERIEELERALEEQTKPWPRPSNL